MVTPQIVTPAAVGKGLNLKSIITMFVLVIVITLLVSYFMRSEVTMYDEEGNAIPVGEVKTRLKWGVTKN